MSIVEHCRQSLRERGVPFNENTQFGVMLSIPAACLTVEDFIAHGCDFLVIGTNDLTQYTHAADRELASAEHYYRPASPAMTMFPPIWPGWSVKSARNWLLTGAAPSGC